MLDIFIFESSQLLEQLEQALLANERNLCLESTVNEIFRIMHTIKGSAAMMMFDNIASLAHAIEDLFFYIRESRPNDLDNSRVCDLTLGSVDFLKNEISKLENKQEADGDSHPFIRVIEEYLAVIKATASESVAAVNDTETGRPGEEKIGTCISTPSHKSGQNRYRALINFSPGCEMENMRAFGLVHRLKDQAAIEDYTPADIAGNTASSDFIKENGFVILFNSNHSWEEVKELLLGDPFVDRLDLRLMENDDYEIVPSSERKQIILEDDVLLTPDGAGAGNNGAQPLQNSHLTTSGQSLISVNVNKLDQLMDMVGELVISEAMVTLNPDLVDTPQLSNFRKAARQHRKIINELQDIVMSIRMVPLSMTFQKMNRIVRDMNKKQDKNVVLEIIGEDTEVDKNIIEHLSDPLMHLIRNAIDHGVESREERARLGKVPVATVRLEAKNEGGDVFVIVKDDGAGLSKEKILARARKQGVIVKSDSELTEAEIFSSILLPGFSTRDEVSEFSGRGVGMDVVARNIQTIGGTVLVESIPGQGTTVTLKIPLTLAIINGMQVTVGSTIYIIPITSIRESFKVRPESALMDPDGNEMIMLRGQCYPLIRLYEHFKTETRVQDIADGIIIVVENDSHSVCLFVDAILGEHQVVVKALPKFIGSVSGVSGCTLLGNGQACLILDIASLITRGSNISKFERILC